MTDFVYIRVPKDIEAIGVAGQRVVESDEAGVQRPLVVSFQRFFLGMLSDPLFSDGKKGIEAAELVHDTRKRVLTELERKDGWMTLTREQHRRARRVIEEASVDPNLAHNFVPFMRAVVDASDKVPAERANGASVSAEA
jgi:hypothetical protein